MAIFTPRYPAKQGVSEAVLVPRVKRLCDRGVHHRSAEPTLPNLLISGVAAIGATGGCTFGIRKRADGTIDGASGQEARLPTLTLASECLSCNFFFQVKKKLTVPLFKGIFALLF